MTKSNIKVNDKITFEDEKLPYEVKAVFKQFVFCSRKFDKKEDDGILEYKVEMQAYMSKKEAFEALKDEVIYTILDLNKNIRSTTNQVFNIYDFKKQKDIETCLDDLFLDLIQLSGRNEVALNHFRVDRTVA